MDEDIHVATVADDGYAPHLATMLNSIERTCRSRVVAHVISLDISDDRIKCIADSAPSIDLRVHPLDPEPLAALPKALGGTHSNAYGLLFLPSLVAAMTERVIALDADILVRHDLTGLWTTDLGDHTVGAVRDSNVCWLANPLNGLAHWRELGLDGPMPYFNSGVLLIDVARWNRLDITSKSLEFLRKHGATVRFADQDALNATLAHSWLPLHPRWNFLADSALTKWAPAAVSIRGWEEAHADPAIVHYAGSVKPWTWTRALRGDLASVAEWEDVARTTRFADWYASDRQASFALRSKALRWRLPRALARRLRQAISVLVHGHT